MPCAGSTFSRLLITMQLIAAGVLTSCCASVAWPQGGARGMGPGGAAARRPAAEAAPIRRPQFAPIGPQVPVKEIVVTGHTKVSEGRIRSYLQTRVGRVFDPELVQQDVHRLTASGLFHNVRTYTRETTEGIILTFEVFERPTIAYVKVVGNQSYAEEYLAQKSGLKVGDALNIYSVDTAAGRIEDFYRSKGFRRTLVTVIEGNQPGDAGVVFSVHEAPKERIWNVDFVGNEIVSNGRLKTQIQSKPAMLKYGLFRGSVNPQQIDEDVQRLTAYYRQLGYFHARVGREIEESSSGAWTTVTFVIDEGPRYQVRQVRFLGNERYTDEELAAKLRLKDGEPYHMSKMGTDLRTLRDLYGSQGYIFANVQADPRFFEEPGELDLVYNISEGEQYRVGEIRVHIDGDHPHTRRSVVLNRLSFAPGEILDSRQIADSERRLKFSQLFRNEPARGVTPRIVVRPPQDDARTNVANSPLGPRRSAVGNDYRGQSPDDAPHTVRRLDIDVYVEFDEGASVQLAQPQRLPPVEDEE